ncbi:MAG: AtpZ/AtpI family protein [Pirellulaceae bacterium]|nr:AtpZ/AtpI family protein [Pirellulaceae bacterium]
MGEENSTEGSPAGEQPPEEPSSHEEEPKEKGLGSSLNPIAEGYRLATKVMVIGLSMVLPVVAGHYIGEWLVPRLGISWLNLSVFEFAGVVAGFSAGLYQIIKLGNER